MAVFGLQHSASMVHYFPGFNLGLCSMRTQRLPISLWDRRSLLLDCLFLMLADTDLQHVYYNHMEDVLDGDTGRPMWRMGEDGERVCEAWQNEEEPTADHRGEKAAGQAKKASPKERSENDNESKQGQRKTNRGCDSDQGQ